MRHINANFFRQFMNKYLMYRVMCDIVILIMTTICIIICTIPYVCLYSIFNADMAHTPELLHHTTDVRHRSYLVVVEGQ